MWEDYEIVEGVTKITDEEMVRMCGTELVDKLREHNMRHSQLDNSFTTKLVAKIFDIFSK